MKRSILLLCIVILSGCGGAKDSGVSEREMYHDKRVDCTSTKRTDEAANVTQCADIRPDAKEIKDRSSNLSQGYNPEDYGSSNYQNITK